MPPIDFEDDPDRKAPAVAPRGKVHFDDDPDRQTSGAAELGKKQSEMSAPSYYGQGVGDFFEGVGNMATFGQMPRIDAGIDVVTGRQPDYDTALAARVKRYEDIKARSPWMAGAGELGGAIGGGIATGAGRLGTNLAARLGAGPVGRFLGFGAEGAAQGAAQGAGHVYSGEIDDYLKAGGTGAAVGGVLGGTLGLAVPRSAVQQRAGDPRTGQPIKQPSEEELKALSDRGYRVLSKIPVTYPNAYKQSILNTAERQMTAQNVAPESATTVFRILERVRSQAGDISPAQVDAIRKSLNNITNGKTPGTESAGVAASILRDSLDDMIQHGARHASDPALATRAAQVVERARGDRAAMFRSQTLTGPLANAEQKAATGGAPVGEQLVTEGNRLLKYKRGDQPNMRGMIDEERARIAAAITPTIPERAANAVAGLPLKTIGTGIGGAVGGGGVAATGNIVGALQGGGLGAGIGLGAGAALERGLRGFSSRGIQGRWEDAAAAMRGRSPAFQDRVRGAVPVAGPGMGPVGQGTVGAGIGVLGTPYPDERDALAWQAMQNMMP